MDPRAKTKTTEEIAVRTAAGEPLRLELRSLGPDDYDQCEELQRTTWGDSFAEIYPGSMMMITQKIGGVVAGAFDEDGVLVGFVLGMTGVRDGRLCHWSHMAAVREGLRSGGLGRHLKLFQRRLLLKIGVELAEWTYDPLESRNAHLNLNRLGALPVEYLRDVYGDGSTSALHTGIGTDRLVVRWELTSPAVEAAIAGRPAELAPSLGEAPIPNVDADGRPRTDPFELPPSPALRIETPSNLQAVKTADLDAAKAWRASTRRAFEAAFAAGYAVRGLLREEKDGKIHRSFYALTADSG